MKEKTCSCLIGFIVVRMLFCCYLCSILVNPHKMHVDPNRNFSGMKSINWNRKHRTRATCVWKDPCPNQFCIDEMTRDTRSPTTVWRFFFLGSNDLTSHKEHVCYSLSHKTGSHLLKLTHWFKFWLNFVQWPNKKKKTKLFS